jgi:hypothetical protein
MKKYIFAIPGLMLAVLACSVFSVTPMIQPFATEASSPILQVAFTSTSLPLIVSPTFTTAPIPLGSAPTLTFTPPALLPSGEAIPIQFGPGGTYMDVADNVFAGSPKTYSVNAMQGQIMSVSVRRDNYEGDGGFVPLQIKGADGTLLCPQAVNTACMFWRGVLPSSQDYYVSILPAGTAMYFTLRVAINSPGTASQSLTYYNQTSHAALTYSDIFAPAYFPSTANYKTRPELTLQMIDTNTYTNTNLGEAYFLLSSNADPQIVATCTYPNPNGGGLEEPKGNAVINGYSFVYSEAGGVAAGNIYEQYIYRTVNNGMCYEVIFFMHYGNIGNYAPGTVKEFDKNDLLQKFNGILSTFGVK